MKQAIRDDRIFGITRVSLAIVDLALLFAFLVLYLFPQTTAQNFAWEIKPSITAVFMGAGYISGAFMFIYAIFGNRWHRVRNSLLPVSTFATVMLVVTLLHYDRFIHTNFAFILWMIIYIVTPFLVPWLWYNNLKTDPGTPEPGDKLVPRLVCQIAGLAGIVTLLFWVVSFIDPNLMISFWPWKLTPLTARTICAWGSLISVGGVILFREQRWSAWRFNIQAIALWQALMVIGSILHREDFVNGSLINGYFIAIVVTLILLAGLYAWMELKPASQPVSAASTPTST